MLAVAAFSCPSSSKKHLKHRATEQRSKKKRNSGLIMKKAVTIWFTHNIAVTV
jgi:hypothetical protein